MSIPLWITDNKIAKIKLLRVLEKLCKIVKNRKILSLADIKVVVKSSNKKKQFLSEELNVASPFCYFDEN